MTEQEFEPVDEMQRAQEDIETHSDPALLVFLRDQVQKLRIAQGNRALAAGRLEQEDREALHGRYREMLFSIEEDLDRTVKTWVREHPTWPWLSQIRGVAEVSAAQVIFRVDIHRAPHISSFWKFCGYAVVNGEADRIRKGEVRSYNAKAKNAVWKIVGLQIRLNGPYRRIYDEAKQRYLQTKARPQPTNECSHEETERKQHAKMTFETCKACGARGEWNIGRVEQASKRKAAKMFLSHLHQVWREAEGLPPTRPYIHAHEADRDHEMLDPWEFVGAARPSVERDT